MCLAVPAMAQETPTETSSTSADTAAGDAHDAGTPAVGTKPERGSLPEQSSQPVGPRTPYMPKEDNKPEPFAFADFTWVPGNSRNHTNALESKYFTGELRVDAAYHYSFNHPKDDTIGGSSEVFRSGELQLTQLGIGGDFHYKNVHGRMMTQFGMYLADDAAQ